MLNSFAAALSPGWVGVTIGTLLALVGLIAGQYWYLRTRHAPSLKFITADTFVVSVHNPSLAEGLEIRFQGRTVPSVISSTIAVWNDGNALIDQSQLETSDRLRIVVRGERAILQASVQSTSRKANEVSLREPTDDGMIELDFDYLDPADGFIVQVLHSGSYGSAGMAGSIKGMPEGPTRWRKKGPHGMLASVFLATIISMTVPWIFISFIRIFIKSQADGLRWWELAIAFVLGIGTMLVSIQMSEIYSRYSLRRFPPSLRSDPGVSFYLRYLIA